MSVILAPLHTRVLVAFCALLPARPAALCRRATKRWVRSDRICSSGTTTSSVVNLCSFAHSLLRLYLVGVSRDSLTMLHAPHTGHLIFSPIKHIVRGFHDVGAGPVLFFLAR